MVTKRKSPPRTLRESPAAYTTGPGARPASSREIAAGEFKARCLALMDDVRDRGCEYIITKRGAPVARLVPVRVERRVFRGSMNGTVTVRGDIVSPIDEPWEALEGWEDE